MKTKTPVLRTADSLRKEAEARQQKSQKLSFDAGLKRAIEEIDKAHYAGKRSVYTLGFSDAVVEELRSKGYSVRIYPPSQEAEISW